MIGVEGTKTPAGDSGRAETPQRASVRRLSASPRKAKCLQRKSTAPFRRISHRDWLSATKFRSPVDCSGRHADSCGIAAAMLRPRRRGAVRRLSVAPRKAKCLERKSTAPFISKRRLETTRFSKFIYSLQSAKHTTHCLVRQRMLKRINHSLRPVLDLKLAEDIAHMCLHCL